MVLWEILKYFPEADLYTSIYKPTKKPRAFWAKIAKHRVYSSKLSKIPLPKLFYKLLSNTQAKYFEKLKLNKYDLVISSSSAFAKFINTKATHIAYIHTPPRFLWGFETAVFHRIPWVFKLLAKPKIDQLKKKDIKYTKKADKIITNSHNIKQKIKEIYKRNSQIIYPPVDIENIISFPPQEKKDFFLTIGRLYPYKKIDLIVRAFTQTNKKLIIIGDGPQRPYLENISGKNIEYKGFVDEETKLKLLKQAKGFVFACDEDFGIVMVEALAAGTPVIAYAKGGSLEIIDTKNGVLFEKQTPNSLKKALITFEAHTFSEKYLRKSAQKFSNKNFNSKLSKIIEVEL